MTLPHITYSHFSFSKGQAFTEPLKCTCVACHTVYMQMYGTYSLMLILNGQGERIFTQQDTHGGLPLPFMRGELKKTRYIFLGGLGIELGLSKQLATIPRLPLINLLYTTHKQNIYSFISFQFYLQNFTVMGIKVYNNTEFQ